MISLAHDDLQDAGKPGGHQGTDPKMKTRLLKGGKSKSLLAWLAFICLFYLICDLRNLDIAAPLAYSGDVLDAYAVHGRDYSVNDLETRLYAPFSQEEKNSGDNVRNLLFQPNANLTLLAYALSGDAITASNIYYLLTYVLAFGIAYYVLGRLGLREPFRFSAALLYALMPFHFQRGFNHILESSYFLTPLLVLVLLWMWSARPLLSSWKDDRWKTTFTDRRSLFALVVIVFLSSFHYYHQFFFALLAGFSALFSYTYRRSTRHLWTGLALAALAVAVLLGKGVFQHILRAPELDLSVSGASFAPYGEAEHYPLKIIQILLPVQGHRSAFLAEVRRIYDVSHDLVNENSTVSLGLLGATGFLILIASALLSRTQKLSVVSKFGLLTVAILLFASMGGFSSVLSTVSLLFFGPEFELTQARAWNRMVIYIGFFAYAAFFLGLQRAVHWLRERHLRALSMRALCFLVGLPLLGLALWDQVPYKITNDPRGVAAYRSDKAFFGEIEARLPKNSAILQMPLVINHESGVVNGVYYTDAWRPYLASSHLKFSFGGDPGSVQSRWLKSTLMLPPRETLLEACRYGFAGILVHRPMLPAAEKLEQPLNALLGKPVTSRAGDFSFYPIAPFCGANKVEKIDLHAAGSLALADAASAALVTDFGTEQLSRQTGKLEVDAHGRTCVVASQGNAGFLSYGPYASFKPGDYLARFQLSIDAAQGESAGSVDVAVTEGKSLQVLGTRALGLTPGTGDIAIPFSVRSQTGKHEFRVFASGTGTVRLCGVRVQRMAR